MQIVLNQQSNYKQNFTAGLNRNIVNAAQNCDTKAVTEILHQKGIANNFQGDKVRAFCSLKVIEIIDSLNQKFQLNFGYPKAIITCDLGKTLDKPDSFGFCVTTPLKNKAGFICPETTIFLNNSKSNNVCEEMQLLDHLSDSDFQTNFNSSGNFLINFIHEFAHAIHENHLLSQSSARKVQKNLHYWNTDEFVEDYHQRIAPISSQMCEYAQGKVLDTLACDLSGRIANCLNSDLSIPDENIFRGTPYEPKNTLTRLKEFFTSKKTDNEYEALISEIWNGNLKSR